MKYTAPGNTEDGGGREAVRHLTVERPFARMAPEREVHVIENRSVPSATVIPVLSYEDVRQASDWLCDVFGFRERLRIGSHRAQLLFGESAVILTERGAGQVSATSNATHSVHVRVADVHAHHEHAKQRGARILHAPEDHPFGERQYTAEDLGGHIWTFSQSIADVAPETWGGTLITPQ